jgi:hypothetical protein
MKSFDRWDNNPVSDPKLTLEAIASVLKVRLLLSTCLGF